MRLDRRIIYLLVALALALPLSLGISVAPVQMKSADAVFKVVEELPHDGKAVFVSLDFGPNSQAENLPQAEVLIEHLLRKKIPFVMYSQYALADTFLESVPATVIARLNAAHSTERWTYGTDWANLGYRPNGALMLQNIAKSDDLSQLLKKDARGNRLSELPLFQKVRSLKDISVLAQFTSLVGTFDGFLQFFQRDGYRPIFLHGCTSITIPQAFIYLDSGQLSGLFEGVAGAAWYSALLTKSFEGREKDSSILLNTGLGVAHLIVILLVVMGNAVAIYQRVRKSPMEASQA